MHAMVKQALQAVACAGENICFEVIANTVKWMRGGGGQRVFRARFSAISKSDIVSAMVKPEVTRKCIFAVIVAPCTIAGSLLGQSKAHPLV